MQQIAAQIPETYRLKRNALSAQFAAGEITAEQFQNGYGALETEQAAEVERNSDAQLSNALQVNQSAQTAINTEISALEQAITTSNDPAEITQLLMDIAEQIPEIYRLRREALQAQYDANEITLSDLESGLAELNTQQAAEIERNSDAQLANALRESNADIQIITNEINNLSDAIRDSEDPAEIASLVVDLQAAIMEKYRLRREFLQKQLDAEEITIRQHEGDLGALDTQERRELGGADTLAGTETQGITDAAQRAADTSRQEAQRTADAAQQAADEQLARALRANQDAQDTISVEVSALENAISESNDPTEITGLLMQIAEQIPETYRLRREALQTQFDAGKITQGQLDNGLAALDIEQSAMIERNSDAQLANALRINSEAAAAISADVSALENQIAQSNDPAEIAALLQQIAAQIPETYRLRREALQKQYDAGEITLSALQTGIAQLNIEESAALEQNSDAMLANALSTNQAAAEAINTHIAGLENRISQSNDPAEIASLLQQIATQIPEIYRLRREALQRQFDAGEITLQALNTGLAQANIDESAALEQNSDAQLANTLSVLSTNAQVVNNSITSLSEQIRNSTDPAEIATLVVDLQNAVMEKYRLQRDVLQKQLDAEEITIGDFNAQLGSINLSETSELTSAAALGGAETDDLRRTSNALLQNALQRAQFNLTGATSESDFETRRRELLRFIEEYYDAEKARIDALMLSESQLRDQQEDTEFARQRALQQATDATNQFAEDRIQTEMRLQDEIADIRDDALEAEADRLQSIEDLQDRHLNRVLDLETRFSRDLEDLRRDRIDDTEDLNIEYQRDLEDLQNRFTRSLIDDVIAFADLTAEQQQRVTESTGFQRGLFDLDQGRSRDRQDLGIESGILRPGSGGYQFYRQQLESGELTDTNLIERLFGREGLAEFTQFGRGVSDAESALEQGILDANQEAVGELIDINTKLGNIDESLSVTGVFENIQERIMQGLNPFVEGITEIFTPIQGAVTAIESLTGVFDAVMDGLSQPSQVDAELAMAAAPEAMTLSADIVNINANSVNLSGDVAGGGNGGASDVNVIVEVRNSDVMLDGEKVGQMVGDVIVKQQQQGRSSLGEES